MTHAPDVWQAERNSWRAVIQLNLVRAVNVVVDVLSSGLADLGPGSPTFEPASLAPAASTSTDDQDDLDYMSNTPLSPTAAFTPLQFSDGHAALKLRLGPLRGIEADLKKLLGAASDEITESSLHGDYSAQIATPFDSPSRAPRRPQEFFVRSHEAWKKHVRSETQQDVVRPSTTHSDATDVIAALRDDIQTLWYDESVRELLRRRKITMEDSAE